MNYEELKFLKKYIGVTLERGSKKFVLSNDMPADDKKFIFNLITNVVFDLYNEEEQIQETEIIYVSDEDSINLEELSLKELRALYPSIKATSKQKFLEQIK